MALPEDKIDSLVYDATASELLITQSDPLEQSVDPLAPNTISDAVTKGIPTAILYAGKTLYDSTLGLVLGNNDPERDDDQEFYDLASKVDRSWAEYYNNNRLGIEIAGELSGLLVPGGIATKVVQASRKGALGSRYLNVFKELEDKKEVFKLKAATAALNKATADEFMSAAWKVRGLGVVDAVAESTAFTALAYVGMNQAQLFDDYSLGKAVFDVGLGSVLLAPFRVLQANRGLNEARFTAEKAYNTANKVREVAPGSASFEGALIRLEDAEKATDPVIGQKLRETAIADFLKETAKDIPGITPVIQQEMMKTSSSAFREKYAFLREIRKFDPELAPDVNTPSGLFKFSKDRNIIQRVSDQPKTFTPVFVLADSAAAVRKGSLRGQVLFTDKKLADAALAKSKKAGQVVKEVNIASRSLWVSNNPQIMAQKLGSFGPGKAIYASSGRELIRTAGTEMKIIADAAKDGVIKTAQPYVSRNLRTGEVIEGDVIATAGDHGVDVSQSGLGFVSVGQRRHFFTDFDDIATTPAEVSDAFFIARISQAKEAPEKFFGLTAVQKKTMPKNAPGYGFYENDIYGLQAGLARGDDLIPVIHTIPDGPVKMLSRQQVEEKLANLKLGIFNRLAADGIGVDDIAVRLNVNGEKFAQGKKEGFALYGDAGKLKDYAAPTHVSMIYDVGALPTREALLGSYDMAARQATQKLMVRGILDNEFSSVMNRWVRGNLEVDTTNVTGVTDAATLVGFSGSRTLGDIDGVVNQIGAGNHQAKIALAEEAYSDIIGSAKAFQNNPTNLAWLSAVANIVRGAAGKIRLARNAQGFGYLVNAETGKAINKTGLLPKMGEADQMVNQSERLFLPKDVTRFLSSWVQMNDQRFVGKHNAIVKANGVGTQLEQGLLYIPPPSAKMREFFALVHDPITEKKTMILAQNAEDLAKRADIIKKQFPGVNVYTKAQIKEYKQLFDDYDASEHYASIDFDQALRKAGATSSNIVEPTGLVLEEMMEFIRKQSGGLINRATATYNSELLQALRFRADDFDNFKTARRGPGAILPKGETNPYSAQISTLFNESRLKEIPWLKSMNDSLNSAVSSAYEGVTKLIPWLDTKVDPKLASMEIQKQIQGIASRTGVSLDYSQTDTLNSLTKYFPQDVASEIVSKHNGLLANLTLTADTFYHITNILTAPILQNAEIRSMVRGVKGDAKMREFLGITIPGTQMKLPTPMRALKKTTEDLLDPNTRGATLARMRTLKDEGIISSSVVEHMEQMNGALDVLTNPGRSKAKQEIYNVYDKAFGWMKENVVDRTNDWIMFYAADATEQTLRAAGVTNLKAIRNAQSTIVRRVAGNYIPGQRPILFQGPLGHAIGLFQTFTFGLVNNLSRYAAEGDKAAIRTFMAGQIGVFGAQSNPVFNMINSRIASSNEDRADLYTATYATAGQTMGDFLLYGAPSVMLQGSLYTRGDLTPINPTIIPTALDEIPIVRATMNYYRGAERISQGLFGNAPLASNTFLEGVALMGISRPLSGALALASGESVTNQGDTISLPEEVRGLSAWTRLAGGRPFDEAKVLETHYRQMAYKAYDSEKIRTLGQGIRTTLRSGIEPDDEMMEEFFSSYTKSGGNATGFSKFYKRAMNEATTPLAERMRNKLQEDPKWSEFRNSLISTEVRQEDPLGEEAFLPE